ncbi:MAG: 16S rRNA (uracil(1498)-N(3))-methyltransferase [Bacilli bacterium]
MQRYMLKDATIQGSYVLGEDHAHHIVRVMRGKPGDELLIALTEEKKSARVRIQAATPTEVTVDVVEWLEEDVELPVQVTIASGLAKGDKWELVLQKGTELGASAFIPIKAARSVVKWDDKKGDSKVKRWSKIVEEASEQSHRLVVPTVTSPVTMKELVAQTKEYDIKLIAYEETARKGGHSAFAKQLNESMPDAKIVIVFGPEGGLTEQEVNFLTEHDFVCCSLGPRILRTETAPLYALASISYQFELLR